MSDDAKRLISLKQKGRKDPRTFQGKRNQILSLSIPIYQFTKNNEFISEWESAAAAYKNTTVNKSHITECCKNKRKTAGGYKWSYKN